MNAPLMRLFVCLVGNHFFCCECCIYANVIAIHFNIRLDFLRSRTLVLFLPRGALSSFPDQRLIVEPIPVSFDIRTKNQKTRRRKPCCCHKECFLSMLITLLFLCQTGIILLLLVRITVIFLEYFKFLAKCL